MGPGFRKRPQCPFNEVAKMDKFMSAHPNNKYAAKPSSQRADSILTIRCKRLEKLSWIKAAGNLKLSEWVKGILNRETIKKTMNWKINIDSFILFTYWVVLMKSVKLCISLPTVVERYLRKKTSRSVHGVFSRTIQDMAVKEMNFEKEIQSQQKWKTKPNQQFATLWTEKYVAFF